MFRTLPYIILLITLVMSGFYVCRLQPEMVDKLLIKVDLLGISKVAQEEQQRIEHIRALSIPYEEKQVLMNRTVFLQATTEMVKLALGKPKEHPTQWQGHEVNYFEYYLGEDKRPTILVFMDDKLVKAYKGSAGDLDSIQAVTK